VQQRLLIGGRLKEERKRLGLSQEAAAQAAGVRRRAYVNWEKGVAMPNAEDLAALSTHGADVLYIITGRREQPSLDDIATLTAAIEIIEEALDKRRAALPPDKKSECVALAYDILKDDGRRPHSD
jgi:transcriptional regulator with XRE-family HTH domain